jgi:hypothetical protein
MVREHSVSSFSLTTMPSSAASSRRAPKEFQNFAAFRDPEVRKTIPDPQSESTFTGSKLHWEELHEPAHAGVLMLYRDFLELRQTNAALRSPSRENCIALEATDGIVAILYGRKGEYTCAVLIDLIGGHPYPNLEEARLAPGGGKSWQPLLSSNEPRFGGDAEDKPFSVPTALVFEAL